MLVLFGINFLMNNKDEKALEAKGIITDALPNTLFRIKLDDSNNSEILAYLSGKMRMHRIRVLVGDKVLIKMDSYGGKGRIIKRL